MLINLTFLSLILFLLSVLSLTPSSVDRPYRHLDQLAAHRGIKKTILTNSSSDNKMPDSDDEEKEESGLG